MESMVKNETRYIIRPTGESSVAVQVFKSGLMARRKHVLFLQQYSGEVDYDSENPENSRVELVFDAFSMVCRDPWLKPEKRQSFLAFVQKEILAADQHETITFTSNRIERISSTRFQLDGTLNFRGSAKPVVFEVIVIQNGKDRLEIDGTARLRMSDYGIGWPSAFFGLVGTKDEVVLRFLLWPERTAAAVPKKTVAV
jgi:polyisoprenoid-binding protein YceI